ncbi:hypothetical protein [Rhizobium sp. RM]|uniref:hypothetical protein n=1 Tax=Rhizobium sp. RM TaxID=2748079 RepID=UPI001AED5FE4|nr:hypothetical protein [Rhizobium sp. RM]
MNRRSPLRLALVATAIALAVGSGAHGQQYKNLEVTPDGRGGAHGTYGNQNFEIYRGSGQPPSGHMGGNRLGTRTERPTQQRGNRGATQNSCFVDGNGNSFCN